LNTRNVLERDVRLADLELENTWETGRDPLVWEPVLEANRLGSALANVNTRAVAETCAIAIGGPQRFGKDAADACGARAGFLSGWCFIPLELSWQQE
jgi:hypothetical protein